MCDWNVMFFSFITACHRWTVETGRGFIQKAQYAAATTLIACREACVANPACNGLDWNANAANQNERCSLSISGSTASREESGISHHLFDRECPGTYIITLWHWCIVRLNIQKFICVKRSISISQSVSQWFISCSSQRLDWHIQINKKYNKWYIMEANVNRVVRRSW